MNHSNQPLGAEFQVDFIDTVSLSMSRINVIELVKQGDLDNLNAVVVCSDKNNLVVTIFGDNKWDLSPYFAQSRSQTTCLNFDKFSVSPSLLLEMKLLTYGWIFHKSGSQSTGAKLSTICTRVTKMKAVYNFLLEHGFHSLAALSNRTIWQKFESHLSNQALSLSTLEQIFTGINSALKLEKWLGIHFGLDKVSSNKLAQDLCAKNKLQKSQTLAIPQRIADEIFGKAIELVEQAWDSRHSLAQIEQRLHDNYIAGRTIVQNNVNEGRWNFLTNTQGEIMNRHQYAQEIHKATPNEIGELLQGLPTYMPGDINGNDWRRYYGQLITACFICCGAFSGMRVSELTELTPHSYFNTEFDGTTFHMLQSRTFKLGQKKATWVTAPIVEKAIQLVTVLTEAWRLEYNQLSTRPLDILWFNRGARSKKPVLISDWNVRLQRFVRHFNITVTQEDYQECVTCNPNSTESIHKYIHQGKPWHLNTHQFRRTLAFFTIKHRLGNTIALKQQFKHLYLQMTDWYCAGGVASRIQNIEIDEELQQLLDSTQIEASANKFFEWTQQDTDLSGAHGKAIVAMRKEGLPHIYSSWEVIYKAVKEKRLTLHGTFHSYCKNGYHCDMDGAVNPAFCVDCSSGSSIIDRDNALWWQSRHLDLTHYLHHHLAVSPSVYAHCITQIRAAELVMNDFSIEYTPYQHAIEVVAV